MPRIDDEWLDCVLYIYPNEYSAENDEEFGGSGFLVHIPSRIEGRFGYMYAVTNWHVVSNVYEPVLRINTRDGKFNIIKTNHSGERRWIQHPNGDDLAIHLVNIDASHRASYLDEGAFLTDSFVDEHSVGPGDDVFMVGKFYQVGGSQSNQPTVRFGNIAMWPTVPVKNHYTGVKQESILVEMRSISGYSGSPVILYIQPLTLRSGPELRMTSHKRLLGINWGHLIRYGAVLDQSEQKHPDKLKVRIDDALAGVVPVSKLKELLYLEEVVMVRGQGEKELAESLEYAIHSQCQIIFVDGENAYIVLLDPAESELGFLDLD